jgi:hypothetical protein
MTETSQLRSAGRGPRPNVRARKLVLILAVIGLLCGVVALIAGAQVRTGFAAAALIVLLTAVYCASAAWFEAPTNEISDIDAPPPHVPLPQSPVTQIYDPPVPPNKSLERTREG